MQISIENYANSSMVYNVKHVFMHVYYLYMQA